MICKYGTDDAATAEGDDPSGGMPHSKSAPNLVEEEEEEEDEPPAAVQEVRKTTSRPGSRNSIAVMASEPQVCGLDFLASFYPPACLICAALAKQWPKTREGSSFYPPTPTPHASQISSTASPVLTLFAPSNARF